LGLIACSGIAMCLVLLMAPKVLPMWLPMAVVLLFRCVKPVPAAMLVTSFLATVTLHGAQHWRDRVLPAPCEGVLQRLEGEVRGLVEKRTGFAGAEYLRFRFSVSEPRGTRCGAVQNLLLFWSDGEDLRAGDRLTVDAVLKRPWGQRNPAGSSAQTAHFLNGTHAVGSVRDVLAHRRDGTGSLAARVDAARADLSDSIRHALPGDSGLLLAALLVGDRRGLADSHWERLRNFGLTHLLVISGLHVSIVAALGLCIGSLVTRLAALLGIGPTRRLLATVPAVMLAFAYALLAGFALPVVRALLMLLPALVLLPLGRSGGGWRLLCFAIVVLLLFQPTAVLGASFWLSCGAVAFLLWAGVWRRRLSQLRRIVYSQGVMVMAMLPASLYWFSSGGTVGSIVNLVAVPIVSLFVVPLGLIGIAIEPVSHSLAEGLWILAAAPLEWLWRAMGYWLPLITRHTVLTAQPTMVAFFLAIFGSLLLPLPGALRRIVLCLALQLPLLLTPDNSGDPKVYVTVLDVGQGTAVLARSGLHAMLYDTGGGIPGGRNRAESVVLPALRSLGITALDLLVVSHLDNDHSAGVDTLRAAIPIAEIWTGPEQTVWGSSCRMGRSRRLGTQLTVRTMSSALPGDTDNNTSCVVVLETSGVRILLPGDIDLVRERQLVSMWQGDLSSDVLLAGHHGSATSSSHLWLKHVRPAHLMVSAGHSNRFGHPSAKVLDAAEAHDVQVWNTATDGAVTIETNRGQVHITSTRHRWRPFWWLWESPLP
jgi:competence protein ComEC